MRGKKNFALIAFLFLLNGCEARTPDFVAQHHILDSGAQLVVLPDHRFPVVTQMVWYPVGSGDETLGKTGVAHLLEHLMFQHEPHLTQGGFSSILAGLGARDNAFTSYDYTAYYQRFHPSQIEKIMALESERLAGLRISEASMAKERAVVIEEYYQRQRGSPLTTLRNLMRPALFGAAHPYGRAVIGTLPDLQGLTKADVDKFFATFYNPARAIIIIAGAVEPARALALAKKFYGQGEGESSQPQSPIPPSDFKQVLQRQSKKANLIHTDARATQAVLLRDYTITNRHILGPNLAASFEVLAEVLGGGASARLAQAFVVKQKRASFATAALDVDGRGPGKLSLQLWLHPGQKPNRKNVAAMSLELNEMLDNITNGKNPATAEEVALAKNRLLGAAVYLKDNPFRLAQFVGSWLTRGHSLESAQNWSNTIEAVSVADVRQAAQYMLSTERALSGVLLPKQ